MNDRLQKDLAALTANIADPSHKPMLRPTITLGLRDLGHDPTEVENALNEFFNETIH